MKIAYTFLAAVTAQFDADFTDDLATNNPVFAPGAGFDKCFSCEATGSTTTATMGACDTQGLARGLQTCPDAASGNPQVCQLSIVKNGSGEITSIRTGCSEPNVSKHDLTLIVTFFSPVTLKVARTSLVARPGSVSASQTLLFSAMAASD